ncbi:mariner Mos1 transposase [Trichonephila clavipes]|nr:mariner Mos1 transposase [Trichonephila clavipes]
MKYGVTILNLKASVRTSNGNMRLHHLQRNQSPCTPVLVRSCCHFIYHKHTPLPCVVSGTGTTTNVQHYKSTLHNLRRAIKSKRPTMLSKGVIFLHDQCANSF